MRCILITLFLLAWLQAEDPPSTKIDWLLYFTPREQLEDSDAQLRAGEALQQLAADSLEQRDQAERQLLALGCVVLPQLAELLDEDPEPELRFRLLRVLNGLWRQPLAAAFPGRWEQNPLRVDGQYSIEPVGSVGPFEGHFRVLLAGTEVYTFEGHSQQSWCVRGTTLYLSEFHPISSGCEVVAVDLDAGAVLWRTQLQGLGPIAHSKYSNAVTLLEAEGEVTVFGNEAAGRYYEVLAAEDGRQLFHKLVD